MASANAKSGEMKQIMKSVISEILEENEGLVKRLFEEAIEDAYMAKAIKDCKPLRKVKREKILKTLEQISTSQSPALL